MAPASTDQLGFHFEGPDDANERVQVPCAACGKKQEIPAAWAKEGARLHFCGPDCRQAWAAEEPDFGVRLERRSGHRGGNWKVQAARARQRDGYACRMCGITEEALGRQLDVHHTIPYKSFRSNLEANKLEHLISLCPSCHSSQEAKVRRDLPLFGLS